MFVSIYQYMMNMSDCESEGIQMFWKVIMRKIHLVLVQIMMEAKEEHTNVIKLVRTVDHTHTSISLRTLWNISFPTVLSSPANGFIVIDNDYFTILIYFNDDINDIYSGAMILLQQLLSLFVVVMKLNVHCGRRRAMMITRQQSTSARHNTDRANLSPSKKMVVSRNPTESF